MKKLVVVLIVAISLLSLTSCEDYAVKTDYEEQQADDIGHDELGGDDTEEDGDIDLDTAG